MTRLKKYVKQKFLNYPELPAPVYEGEGVSIEDVVILDKEECILLFVYNVDITKVRLCRNGKTEYIRDVDPYDIPF